MPDRRRTPSSPGWVWGQGSVGVGGAPTSTAAEGGGSGGSSSSSNSSSSAAVSTADLEKEFDDLLNGSDDEDEGMSHTITLDKFRQWWKRAHMVINRHGASHILVVISLY